MLSDDEIAGVLDRCPANPADALVSAALDAGGADNVTVIVIGPVEKDVASAKLVEMVFGIGAREYLNAGRL